MVVNLNSFAALVYLAVAEAHLALRLFGFSFPFLEPLDKSGISRHPVAQRIANRHGRLRLLFSFADSTARQVEMYAQQMPGNEQDPRKIKCE